MVRTMTPHPSIDGCWVVCKEDRDIWKPCQNVLEHKHCIKTRPLHTESKAIALTLYCTTHSSLLILFPGVLHENQFSFAYLSLTKMRNKNKTAYVTFITTQFGKHTNFILLVLIYKITLFKSFTACYDNIYTTPDTL